MTDLARYTIEQEDAAMTTRRDLLKIAAYATSGTALLQATMTSGATKSGPKTLLILGDTGFIGPHLTREALRLDWKVTHFNRGMRASNGVPGVETLTGDRRGKLDELRDRRWDVVIDDTGYIPKYVKMSAELLAPNVGYCLYISSISVYAGFATPNHEGSPTGKLSDPNIEEITNDTYGPMKALCEQYSDIRASPTSGTKVTWVPEKFLASRWNPDDLDLPPWSPLSGDSAGASLTSILSAGKTGLRSRPIADTVRDTLAWFHTLPADRQSKLRAGLAAEKESDTLRAWHQSNG